MLSPLSPRSVQVPGDSAHQQTTWPGPWEGSDLWCQETDRLAHGSAGGRGGTSPGGQASGRQAPGPRLCVLCPSAVPAGPTPHLHGSSQACPSGLGHVTHSGGCRGTSLSAGPRHPAAGTAAQGPAPPTPDLPQGQGQGIASWCPPSESSAGHARKGRLLELSHKTSKRGVRGVWAGQQGQQSWPLRRPLWARPELGAAIPDPRGRNRSRTRDSRPGHLALVRKTGAPGGEGGRDCAGRVPPGPCLEVDTVLPRGQAALSSECLQGHQCSWSPQASLPPTSRYLACRCWVPVTCARSGGGGDRSVTGCARLRADMSRGLCL